MTTQEDIRRIVMSVLEEQFGEDVRIVSVEVEGDIDHDGDPILRVSVVYDTASGKLDARKTSGMVRHLRPKLEEASETRFPIMSYIDKSDAEEPRPETV